MRRMRDVVARTKSPTRQGIPRKRSLVYRGLPMRQLGQEVERATPSPPIGASKQPVETRAHRGVRWGCSVGGQAAHPHKKKPSTVEKPRLLDFPIRASAARIGAAPRLESTSGADCVTSTEQPWETAALSV